MADKRAKAPRADSRGVRRTAARFWTVLRPHRPALGWGLLAYFAAAGLDPLLPALFKHLLDNGFKSTDPTILWLAPLAIIGLFAARGALNFAGSYLFAWSTSQAVLQLRSDLVEALLRADASLFSHLSPGVAANRVINDPQNGTGAMAAATTTLLRDGTTLVALLGYLFYLDWQLTALSLVTCPVIAIVMRHVQRRVLRVSSAQYESQVRLVGIVDDIARAWRVVRTFDAAGFERRRFDAEAAQLRRQGMKAVTAGAMMTPLTQLATSIGIALVVSLALAHAQRGDATVGDFVAFVTALLMTVSPLRHLTDVTQPIVGGLIQLRACFDLIDCEREPDPGHLELAAGPHDLRMEQATVIYAGSERRALNEVSLDIPAGSTVALVGASGAGKSTLVSTLLGFVEPSHGRVSVDGIGIENIRKASLRRQFAVVSQDIVLFDGSIAANVIYAQPPDTERAAECLRAADLWPFVASLPEGIHTLVGTNGSRLSGGQRQRLAIARALYKDASIWLFDEATSALDSNSERQVHDAIERWRGERTLLLIAHRMSTVRHADCIHVLAEGRVAESGSHEALMAIDGLYAAMVRTQAVS